MNITITPALEIVSRFAVAKNDVTKSHLIAVNVTADYIESTDSYCLMRVQQKNTDTGVVSTTMLPKPLKEAY